MTKIRDMLLNIMSFLEKTEKQNFEFKYLGQSDFIDLNTLLVSQFQYLSILTEIKEVIAPDTKFKIKVDSFNKGSFGISHTIELAFVSSGFGIENIKMILTVLSEYLQIKAFLKDKKADSIKEISSDKIEINGNNNTLIVYKPSFEIYQKNASIDKAFKKNGEILAQDENIEGIKISSKDTNEAILDISREKFGFLTIDNAYIEDRAIKEVIKKNALMQIKKLELTPGIKSKWSFIWEGLNISALILDEEFLKQVKSGRKFGNGDKLVCDLRIVQKYDIDLDAYINDKYEIIKVNEIIERPVPKTLF